MKSLFSIIFLGFLSFSALCQTTWYSFQSGNWGNELVWTMDGATAPTYVNPDAKTPETGDRVIIRNNHSIVMRSADGSAALNSVPVLTSMEVRSGAVLDLQSTTGHNFTTIRGGGTINLAGQFIDNGSADYYLENLPAGNYTLFADRLLGGTLQYNTGTNNVPLVLNAQISAVGGASPVASNTTVLIGGSTLRAICRRTVINMADADDRVILQRSIAQTGNLRITQGNFQIHSDDVEPFETNNGAPLAISNTNLTLNIDGNVIIDINGVITTGTANNNHQFNLNGDFTNDGTQTTSFTQLTSQSNATLTNGIVDLNFLNTTDNQELVCNGPTNIYRIEINKGAQSVELSILAGESAGVSHFRLFGRSNFTINANLNAGSTNDNSVGLLTGAIKLGVNVNIPVICSATIYSVSSDAALIVDGGLVGFTGNNAMVLYGTIEVRGGEFIARGQSGITTRDSGTLRVSGGSVFVSQFRTSVNGPSAVGGFDQSGGEVTVGTFSLTRLGTTYNSTTPNSGFYTMSLTYTNNVFIMSGGILNVNRPRDATYGSIFINSDPGNINVTGGTVNVTATANGDAKITTRAPFYNLNILNSTGTITNKVVVSSGNSGGVTITDPEIIILNDFTIGGGVNPTRFDHLGNNVTIGRNFTIALNGQYYFGADNLLPNNSPNTSLNIPASHQNTTTFNGSLNGTINLNNITTDNADAEQLFFNLTISKTANSKITVTAVNKTASGDLSNALRTDNNGAFRLESGTLDQGTRSLRFLGDIYNAGSLGVFEPGVTSLDALLKVRQATLTIETEPGAIFGNFRLNASTGIVTLENDVTIGRLQYRHGRLNIGSNNVIINELDVDLGGAAGFNSCGGCFSVEDMIITDGLASDGGLTLRITSAANPTGGSSNNLNGNAIIDGLDDNDFLFPVGIGISGVDDGSAKYTPLLLSLSDVGDLGADGIGYITVNPVDATLSTANLSSELIDYHWRVRTSGFVTPPTVDFIEVFGKDEDVNSINYMNDATALANYIPGFVEDGGDYLRMPETGDVIERGSNPAFEGTDFSITYDGEPDASGFILADLNLTAGEAGAFTGTIQIFYSNESGSNADWDEGASWNSLAEIAADPINGTDVTDEHDDDINQIGGNTAGVHYPGPGDIAILGVNPDNGQPHSIRIERGITANAAEFRFVNNVPILAAGRGGFSFKPELVINSDGGIPTVNINQIRGEGVITDRNNTDPDLSNVDIGDYINQPESFYLLESFQNSFTYNNLPSELPNVIFTSDGFGDNDRTTTVRNDLKVNGIAVIGGGVNLLLNNDTGNPGDGDLDIGGDLIIINGYELFPSGAILGDGANSDPELRFPGSTSGAVASRSVTVGGNLELRNRGARIRIANSGANNASHSLSVAGDIIDSSVDADGGIDLFANTDRVVLKMNGVNSATFTRNNANLATVPDLYQLIVSKENINDTILVTTDINLPLPATIARQPLEVVNGLLILNNNDIDITLTDATRGNYLLPNTANLEASSGSGGIEMRGGIIRIGGNNTGLILDGPLVLSGGDADFIDGGNNTFIEYSSSGNAAIAITNSNSKLEVGSQIRRSTLATSGVLNLMITAGELEIGGGTNGVASRGMLEIMNAGSSFIHTGGSVRFFRQNGTTSSDASIASLFLEPSSSNISSTSTIEIDLRNGDPKFAINSSVPLNNLTLLSSGADNGDEVVQLRTRSLTLNGNLNVSDDIEFRTNNLNLTIFGDLSFSDDSEYTPGINMTTFSAAGTASLIANSSNPLSFYSFEKNGSGTLNLNNGDISITGATFDLLSGTFADNDNLINFSGQVMNNNAFHTSLTGGVSKGIVFNSTSQQTLSTDSEGSFGNVTLNNPSGVSLPDFNQQFTVDSTLTLVQGILDIGPALLIFGENGKILNNFGQGDSFDDFSEAVQIQTNSSIIDFGVQKAFPAGANGSFFYPVGEATRYTPILLEFNATTTTAGSIRVRPRNRVAPIMESELQSIQDKVLQYHWIINSNGFGNDFDANLTFNYDQEVIGSDEANYLGAIAFFNDPELEIADGLGSLDEVNNTFTIPINLPIDTLSNPLNFSGEYFAGDPNDIPDAFATLIFDNASGDGLISNIANFFQDLDGDGIRDSPGEDLMGDFAGNIIGSAVLITDNLTMTVDETVTFSRLNIPNTSTLLIDYSDPDVFNLQLGQVSGSGTIAIISNGNNAPIPPGDYNSFFTPCGSGGGALSYGGSGSYPILAETNRVRQLTLEGGGTKSFPANLVTICEDLIINGGTSNLASGTASLPVRINILDDLLLQNGTLQFGEYSILDISDNAEFSGGTAIGGTGAILEISGDLIQSGGAVISMTGVNRATLRLDGTVGQSITGNFNGSNSVGNLTINNTSTSGVTITSGIANRIRVNNLLTLIDGVVHTDIPVLANPIVPEEILILSSLASVIGGSAASHIDGVMEKEDLGVSENFEFPIGDNSFYAPMSVKGPNMVTSWSAIYRNQLPPRKEFISADFNNDISFNEYWVLDGESAGATANVAVTYGIQSDVTDASGLTLALLKDVTPGANFDNETWSKIEVNNLGSNNDAGTLTTNVPLSFSTNVVTLGEQSSASLPISLVYFKVQLNAKGQAVLEWQTATETNNDYFLLEKSVDGEHFIEVNTMKGQGDSKALVTYQLIDFQPYAGLSYYRLKQVDFDGAFEYFPLAALNNKVQLSFDAHPFPNPVTGNTFKIRLSTTDFTTPIHVQIIGLEGKLLFDAWYDSDQIVNDLEINTTSDIGQGMYLLRTTQGFEITIKRLIFK